MLPTEGLFVHCYVLMCFAGAPASTRSPPGSAVLTGGSWARWGGRRNAVGVVTPPHPETITRVFAQLDAQALATHTGVFLAGRPGTPR